MDNNTKDILNNIIGLVLILGFFISVGKCSVEAKKEHETTKQTRIIYKYKTDSLNRVGE